MCSTIHLFVFPSWSAESVGPTTRGSRSVLAPRLTTASFPHESLLASKISPSKTSVTFLLSCADASRDPASAELYSLGIHRIEKSIARAKHKALKRRMSDNTLNSRDRARAKHSTMERLSLNSKTRQRVPKRVLAIRSNPKSRARASKLKIPSCRLKVPVAMVRHREAANNSAGTSGNSRLITSRWSGWTSHVPSASLNASPASAKALSRGARSSTNRNRRFSGILATFATCSTGQ